MLKTIQKQNKYFFDAPIQYGGLKCVWVSLQNYLIPSKAINSFRVIKTYFVNFGLVGLDLKYDLILITTTYNKTIYEIIYVVMYEPLQRML